MAGPITAWYRSAALAITLALTVITAPLPMALKAQCSLCPPSCPMHRHDAPVPDPGEASLQKMKCHGTRQHAPEAPHGPRISRPPCGNHSAVVATAQPPMVLAAAPAWMVAPRVGALSNVDRIPASRGAEPPDTPPPIRTA